MKITMLLLCLAALIIPATAQHFKQVTGFTGVMQMVAAGHSEVWGINTSGQVFRLIGSKFASVPGSLSRIYVGGGTLLQKDEIWGVDESGNVFHFNYGTKSFTHVAGSLQQIAVGEGDIDSCHPYEVWGIDFSDKVFRYNYCTNKFDQAPGSFVQVATAGGAVWGVNVAQQLYAFNFSTGQFQYTTLNGYFSLAADNNDCWALGPNGNIFAAGAFNGGYSASHINGTIIQLAAGDDGVWGIDPNQRILRFDPAVGSFVDAPGFFTQIAVGSGAGVWGVAPNSGEVFTFVRP
jgi:Tectonin domain